jgi:flavin reductase (DIM6/NTAB) family NADH-FMN oxidoreductase RutF
MVASTSAGIAGMPAATPVPELFRRLTNGVYVIGVSHNGRSNAFTAAWLTQVSFDPLLVALSVNKENFSFSLLQPSGVFVINVLRKGQLDLALHFGTQSGREVDKLAGRRWRPGRLGAPVLLDGAAYFECRVTGTVSAGDHQLVLARVTDGAILEPDAATLPYADTGDMDGSGALYPESL